MSRAAVLLRPLLALWAATSLALAAFALDLPAVERLAQQRYGAAGVQAVAQWRRMIGQAARVGEAEKLRRVNDHWNRSMRFSDDPTVWSREDYWATPLESMGRGEGDCEDFVIGKYFSLRELGVAEERLRITYVRAQLGGADGLSQAHMVLSYYPAPEAMPLVLDNLRAEIRPASERPDLIPVFSFNADGVYSGGAQRASTPVERLTRWRDLIARMRAEGFLPPAPS